MVVPSFEKLTVPLGNLVNVQDPIKTPDDPMITVIKGDGSARTIGNTLGLTDSAIKIIDTAVEIAYQGIRKIQWLNAYAGDAARELYAPNVTDEHLQSLSAKEQQRIYLPEDTIRAIEYTQVALKGPLATPIGEGFRSINVTLRKLFDLYACIRPVQYFAGAPSPNTHVLKHGMNVVIFRENVEDIYAGIEFKAGTVEQRRLQDILIREFGADLDSTRDYGIGIKPMSEQGSKRLVRQAIEYALAKRYPSVTLMHKGNIMKFTEGAFRDCGYHVAQEYPEKTITEQQLWSEFQGKCPKGKIVIKDRIADNLFQQLQLAPQDYSVIATPNLNGDYLSDAAAALIGGLGIAPGANIGDHYALFEATHGTAPDLIGQDKANPSSIALSGAMMLEYLGWGEASALVRKGIEGVIADAGHDAEQGIHPLPVTGDLAKQYSGYTVRDGIRCSEFVQRVLKKMHGEDAVT